MNCTWLVSPSLISLIIVALSSCSSAPQVVEPQPVARTVELNQASISFSDDTGENFNSTTSRLLNVSIATFDKGILDQTSKRHVYNRVRKAESNYLPVVLRNTLLESGHWGAVRVIPEIDPTTEVSVTAEILKSTAVELSLKVRVIDARGVVWLDQVYSDISTDHGYGYGADYDVSEGTTASTEPFQDLYNDIANDMSLVRSKLGRIEISNILDMATLRYAIALSPGAFGEYLEVNEDGSVEMSGLPARNDTMYSRVKKIRESEYRFIDIMDEQYDSFFKNMQTVYPYWRQYSYELMVYNRELEQVGNERKSRAGNWTVLKNVYHTYQEFKMNEDALRELSSSFESEIKPTEAELEGQVVELNGSLQNQYTDWRKLLQEIYTLERGN